MVFLASQSGKVVYGIKDYCLDSPQDLTELFKHNTDLPGSTATVISTGEKYILNSKGEWILQP